MDRHRHLMNIISLALVVVFTAAGSSLMGSLVLCVGSNGHTDLEVAFGTCCIDEAPGRVGSHGDSCPALVDPCGDCDDIELDSTSLTKGKQRLEPPHLAAMNEPVQARAFPASLADSGLPTSPGSPHLEGLATVVLLT